jgi:hypothetical protein
MPESLAGFVSFCRSYEAILKLLDSALAAWPRPPVGWDRYVEHLSTLDRHRAAVAALMTHHGIPDAGTAVADVVRGCAWARAEVEARPCPPERVGHARLVVGELRHPLLHLAELVELGPARPGEAQGGGGPSGAMPGGGTPKENRPRMTVKVADQKARELHERLGWDFLILSERKQAEAIGCSWSTWKNTDFYKDGETKGLFRKRPARGGRGRGTPPAVVGLTDRMEATVGQGGPDAVLKELIAQQTADSEPSPLEDDLPDSRPKKIKARRRV